MDAVDKQSILIDEDWFFYSTAEMTDWKIDPSRLMNEYSFVDVLRLREYLTIKSVKEEAYRRDDKMRNPDKG